VVLGSPFAGGATGRGVSGFLVGICAESDAPSGRGFSGIIFDFLKDVEEGLIFLGASALCSVVREEDLGAVCVEFCDIGFPDLLGSAGFVAGECEGCAGFAGNTLFGDLLNALDAVRGGGSDFVVIFSF
jgi:hypothetical protein